jgi:hypothetical protein
MADNVDPRALGHQTEFGPLCERLRVFVGRAVVPVALLVVLETFFILHSGKVGAIAFALVGAGTCIVFWAWSRNAKGLPLLPIIAAQNLVIYGMPIAANHEVITTYPPDFTFRAAVEVLVFDLCMAAAWMVGMNMIRPSPPVSHTLNEFDREGAGGWSRLGFGLILASTTFLTLDSMNLLGAVYGLLPTGSNSILTTLVSIGNASGLFLVSMVIGQGRQSAMVSAAFWALLILSFSISASSLLLADGAASLVTVSIGLFWGSGRMPWRYVIATFLLLSFLNIGKTSMRARYWDEDGNQKTFTVTELPSFFAEWAQVSYSAILENYGSNTEKTLDDKGQQKKNQTLLDRIDNLQNLLFVMDAVETYHVKPLEGATYRLIPPLFIPRVFWPDKPRTHEGQVLLNVHFGRQLLESTFTTYIAWGLIPEAYGNFGPYMGSILLGLLLGISFAWVENLTANKLVISTEGFLSLGLVMNLINSFEMVASVLVTTTFQSSVVIVLASMPFVRRTVTRRSY